MSIEFVVQRHCGTEDHLDRDDLIQEMTGLLRDDLECDLEDQISDLEDHLSVMSDEELAKEHRDRTGELVRIEESEEED